MNAFNVIFKSGTSVIVYMQANDPEFDEDVVNVLNNDNVDAIIDITANLINEAKWLCENKQVVREVTVNRNKIQVDSIIASQKYENAMVGAPVIPSPPQVGSPLTAQDIQG